jgi:type II secretory pathway component GspD/PulD (secretin)
MKKLMRIFVAVGAACWIASAGAQTGTNVPPDDSIGQPMPPPGMNGPNGGPPDGGGPPQDMNGQLPPDNNTTPSGGGNIGFPRGNNAPILPTKPFTANQAPLSTGFLPPESSGTNSNALILNFRNAPLEMVLNYLSDAAGFVIILDTAVHGNVSVISSRPMTQDEAVDLLNSVLNQNGYAAIRDGHTLTIVDKNDAKTRDIPVKVSNDPDDIPKNDEIVTQIIPIRFVDAGDLVKDLSSFVSPEATVVANDAGNSIVITDTQSNIRHIVEIIRAIDNSAEAETEIRVFHLQYASPTDVANELSSVFPNSSSGSGNNQAPIRFGGPGGFFGRMFGGGGFGGGPGGAGGGVNTASSSANDRIKKATQVTAVADSRIQAVIVTAPKDLIEEIADMMKELDVPSPRDQQVFVFHLKHGDPYEVSQVLQNQFSGSTSSRSGSSGSSTSQSALQLRQQNSATSTSSSGSTVGSSFSGTSGGGRGGGGGGGGF